MSEGECKEVSVRVGRVRSEERERISRGKRKCEEVEEVEKYIHTYKVDMYKKEVLTRPTRCHLVDNGQPPSPPSEGHWSS